MSRKENAIMKMKNKNNKGFSTLELVIAIAIVAILGVMTAYVMNTSSKSYSDLTEEAQIQNEAQMVANMITELAIDSYDAKDMPETTDTFPYVSTQKKILLLESMEGSTKKQYIIGRKDSENSVYLAERSYNATSSSWGAVSEALLGDYVIDFNVDTSRVEKENILRFTLSYRKNGRTFDGNYQVLMRNKAFADKGTTKKNPDGGELLAISIDPTLVYVDIVGDSVQKYYKEEVTESAEVNVTSSGIPFTSTVNAIGILTDENVEWSLKNADSSIFKMSANSGSSSNLTWSAKTKTFNSSPIDMFMLVATKQANSADGTKVIAADPKTAQILLRRIKNVSLYSLSGTTSWKEEYELVGGGQPSAEAQGYAYIGNDGKYLPVNLSASISSSNIAYGGGLTWEIFHKSTSSTSWLPCAESKAKLTADETLETTNNVVTLGGAVTNTDLFKVVATSVFDPSYSAEYIFGVAPAGIMEGDGFYSRGYYTNMSAFYKDQTVHGSDPAISKVAMVVAGEVDGVGEVNRSADKVKVIQDESGNWRLFVDFEAFAYNGAQKKTFYGTGVLIHLVVVYWGTDGKLYVTGDLNKIHGEYDGLSKGQKIALMAQKIGVSPSDITEGHGNDLKYELKPVVVTKVSPVTDPIVVEKGKSRIIKVSMPYYNILEPTKGFYYFGAYIEDMWDNLLESGKDSVHPYFSIRMASQYGTVKKYIDSAAVEISAKDISKQKKYLVEPMTLRLTANDYYRIDKSPNAESYKDYKVLIANVENASCYIPGPYSKGDFSLEEAKKNQINAGSEVTVQGYDTSGAKVDAKIKKKGNKYVCIYAGKEYTYNPTYDFWAK